MLQRPRWRDIDRCFHHPPQQKQMGHTVDRDNERRGRGHTGMRTTKPHLLLANFSASEETHSVDWEAQRWEGRERKVQRIWVVEGWKGATLYL